MNDKDEPEVTFAPSKIPEERPGPEGGKRHRNRLARTRSLCEAGLARFLEQGLASATIDDVVQEAGMSKGSFYRYFSNKEALIGAIFQPLHDAILEAQEEANRTLTAASDAEQLTNAYRAFAARLATLLFQHADAVQLFLQERHGARTAERAPIHALDDAIFEGAIGLTHAGRAHGLLKPMDPRVSGTATVGAVHELLWRYFQGQGPEDPLAAAEQLIDMVLHGVGDARQA